MHQSIALWPAMPPAARQNVEKTITSVKLTN